MLKKIVGICLIAMGVSSWAGDRLETKHYSFEGSSDANGCTESLEIDYPVAGPQKVLKALQKAQLYMYVRLANKLLFQ